MLTLKPTHKGIKCDRPVKMRIFDKKTMMYTNKFVLCYASKVFFNSMLKFEMLAGGMQAMAVAD